jgi:hypothetical protein
LNWLVISSGSICAHLRKSAAKRAFALGLGFGFSILDFFGNFGDLWQSPRYTSAPELDGLF